LWLHSLKVAQLLRSAACLHTNQSRSYLNHLVVAGVTKTPMQFLKSPLPYIKVQRVHGPRFSDKQNSDRNAQLIPTLYSGNKQKKRKRKKNHILCRN